jgi:cell pole-organizing protein PopZ
MAPAAAAAAATVPAGGRSLEDVVVDAMRPMLKQWLDANLPAMVESMVAREISRITGKRL